MSVGQLIPFVLYPTFVGASLTAELYAQIQKQLQPNVFELLDETPEKINSVRDLATIEKIKGNVTFKNVVQLPFGKEIKVLKTFFTANFGQNSDCRSKGTENRLLLRYYCFFIILMKEKVDGKKYL
jgi:hypothetical protein